MLKGRYVKSANITGGAAGISLMLIYAGIVTKSTNFLQLALSWDKYIDILSFKVRGRKVWCNGVLSNKYNSTLIQMLMISKISTTHPSSKSIYIGGNICFINTVQKK